MGRAVFVALNVISPQNTLADNPRIMLEQISGHFVAQSYRHIKLVIIYPKVINHK